jgi:hypothetical protein
VADPASIIFLRAAVAAFDGANDPRIISGRDAVAAWINGERGSVSFEEATGLRPTAGHATWPTEHARRVYSDLIRAYATAYFPQETFGGRAHTLRKRLVEYARHEWCDDQRREICPSPDGTERAFLFRIMKAHSRAYPTKTEPLSADRIGRILRGK